MNLRALWAFLAGGFSWFLERIVDAAALRHCMERMCVARRVCAVSVIAVPVFEL